MWQVATPVSGSSSRKLAQPLVPQKSRVAAVAAVERRRMRRMAEARPVTDDVAERDIMMILLCAFWRAVIAREAIGCAAGVPFVGPNRGLERRCLKVSARRTGAWVERSNRVVASDWLPR
jgi:hypothetical protein